MNNEFKIGDRVRFMEGKKSILEFCGVPNLALGTITEVCADDAGCYRVVFDQVLDQIDYGFFVYNDELVAYDR